MKKYIICKYNENDDTETIWTIASSKEEAISNILDKYWDECWDDVRFEVIGVEDI